MNSNWPRWITASIVKHIQGANTQGHRTVFNGTRKLNKDHTDWIEVRQDGPTFTTMASNTYRVDVYMEYLLQTVVSDSNIYKHVGVQGDVIGWLTSIPVYETGEDTDSGDFIGCLVQSSRAGKDIITISPVPTIDIDTPLTLSLIGIHYEMEL